MKQGRNVQELATELQRQLKSKRDYRVPTERMEMFTYPLVDEVVAATESTMNQVVAATERRFAAPQLMIANVGEFGLTQHAHGQLAGYLGIPQKYYDLCLNEAPDLLSDNVNHWLRQRGEGRLLRTLDDHVRAVLSTRYRMIDNWDLTNSVLPTLLEAGCEIVSCEVTENHLYLKAVTPRLEAAVKLIRPGTHERINEPVQMGIVVSNSETGQGSVRVEPLLYVLACTNGAIVQSLSTRKFHIGRNVVSSDEAVEVFSDETRRLDDAALFAKVKDVVKAAFDEANFRRFAKDLTETTQRAIATPVEKLTEVIQVNHGVSAEESGSILQHLVAGGSLSQWGLSNAITRAAQDAASYERATELERLGGGLLTLAAEEFENKYGKN